MTNGTAPRRADTLIPCGLLLGLLALVATLGFLVGHAVGGDQTGAVTMAAPVNPTGPAVVIPVQPTTTPPVSPTTTPEAPPTPTVAPTPTPSWTPDPSPPQSIGRPCGPEALRCVQIAGVARSGNLLTIDWLSHGFEPNRAGSYHAHFFWDIYEPMQAGNNAASFGMSSGSWDAVDAQPYVKDLSTRPDGATAFCVTVGTPTHGVDDPTYAECVAIPDE